MRRRTVNFFEPRLSYDPLARERVRAWVLHTLGAPSDDVAVGVTELRCDEPGCPPIETAITIMRPGLDVEIMKIHKPVAAITQSDIAALGGYDHGNRP